MKFKKVEPKVSWTAERTREQLAKTMNDIADLNRSVNKVDTDMKVLYLKRQTLQRKTANKWRYARQLEEQLAEIIKREEHGLK